MAGFLEAQSLDLKSIKLPNFTFSVGVSTCTCHLVQISNCFFGFILVICGSSIYALASAHSYNRETCRPMQITAKKPTWKIGSSFALKKPAKTTLPKINLDDDLDLIDEDSLLTEEDLKKPQVPVGN